MKPSFLPGILLLVAFGCGESAVPTEVADRTGVVQSNFTNGPSALPNVVRFEDRLFFIVQFPAEDLLLAIGVPEDPADLPLCGGSETPGELVPVQDAGQLQEVIKRLVLASDVTLHVWDLSDFFAAPSPRLCNAPLFAQGTADLRNTDNDLFFLGGTNNANSFGASIRRGLVEDAAGTAYRLTASWRFINLPDGTFKIAQQHINLRPIQ
ncbi:MAG: hypothetical protein ACREK3_05775 [Gemmatimonadota bacterium]